MDDKIKRAISIRLEEMLELRNNISYRPVINKKIVLDQIESLIFSFQIYNEKDFYLVNGSFLQFFKSPYQMDKNGFLLDTAGCLFDLSFPKEDNMRIKVYNRCLLKSSYKDKEDRFKELIGYYPNLIYFVNSLDI